MLFQEKPGLINVSCNQMMEVDPKEYQESLSTLGSFINIVKAKQERMPKHFILNLKNEYHFHGAVGQFIEHADNIGTPNKDKEEK
jgi:hypothetical protein